MADLYTIYMDETTRRPGSLVLIRAGMYLEAVADAATIVADLLGITITRAPNFAPIAGIPVYREDEALHKLTAAGHKVEIVTWEAGR